MHQTSTDTLPAPADNTAGHSTKPRTPTPRPTALPTVSTTPTPPPRRTRHHRGTAIWITALAVAVVLSAAAAVIIGPADVSPAAAARIIGHHLAPALIGAPDAAAAKADTIVWSLRAPRILLAATVGAGLAITGVVMQALVRNILADPYILGVNSGASVGAAVAILFGAGAGMGDYALQGCAFLGALAAIILVLALARAGGRMIPVRLLMAGVTIGYALSAATSFLIFASDSAEGSRSVMFWLLGSLGLASWSGPLAVVVIIVAVTTAALLIISPTLDVLNLGDDIAQSLGINPDRIRVILLTACCLVVGAVVAMAGSIGFIGLIAPHLARRLVGVNHRPLIITSALIGALLLIWADLASRTLLAPQEIPIGVITALIGAPLLLILIHRFQHA